MNCANLHWIVLAAGLSALVCAGTACAGTPDPIQKVEIGKNREFIVNGKVFFPVMSWAQTAKHYGRLPDVGFNVHCGTSDPDAAAATGCYAIPGFKAEWAKHPNVLAFIHGDEPDMPKDKGSQTPKHTPEEVADQYKKIKEADTMHPVFVTFTGHFTKDNSRYSPETKAAIYSAFVKSCEVAGFDIYPIYGSGMPCHLTRVAEGVSQLREIAGNRPVYAWIESNKGSKWMTYEKQPDVLPMHTRCEVWMAIIRGATAIGYFTHAWRPDFKEFAPTPEMQKEMKRLNTQIVRLAPAIVGDPSKRKIEMKLNGGLACHFKATEHDGALCIFAENIDLGEGAEKLKQFDPIKPRGGKAVFSIEGMKAGTKIEVVDENRTVAAEDGKFSDDFAPLAEHIYKIKP